MSLVIDTARLRLSEYAAADVEAVMLNAGPPEVARMMASIPQPFTREAAQDRIALRPCDDRRFILAIRDRETGEAVGEIGAGCMESDGTPRHGYFLRSDVRGRGLAGEAIAAALDDGTGLIGVASLSRVGPGMRRLGFWLGVPYWGLGLMSEAISALVRVIPDQVGSYFAPRTARNMTLFGST